jgi:hypothetical protein
MHNNNCGKNEHHAQQQLGVKSAPCTTTIAVKINTLHNNNCGKNQHPAQQQKR